MSAHALSLLSLICGIFALVALGVWLRTGRRSAWMRIVAGLFVMVAAVSGYISRLPEKPVAGQGSLVGARTPGDDPAASRCAQARAFSANIPPECRH